MLTTFQQCGHCGKTGNFHLRSLMQFEGAPIYSERVARQVAKADSIPLKDGISIPNADAETGNNIWGEVIQVAGIASCPTCAGPVMMAMPLKRLVYLNHEIAIRKGTNIRGFELADDTVKCYPTSPDPITHESWPDAIKLPFADAQDLLTGGKSPSIIIATCRTVIDVCLDDLGATGKTIFKKIENLLSEGKITTEISEWFHDIRKFGANATHDANGTHEDAEAFVSFLRYFLDATYTWPARIAYRRKK